jgi:hypothetical protein
MKTRMLNLMTLVRRLWRPALTAGVVLAVGGCIEWEQTLEAENPSIKHYISAVSVANASQSATLREGAPPAAGPSPIITAPIPALVLLGGTVQIKATSPTPFSKLAVVVPGVDDYWELEIGASVTSVDILIVFGQEVPTPVFQMRLAGSTGGNYGTYQESGVSMITVGTGDVQVNITWNSAADVDLHVVDPIGDEAFWAHTTTVSGGQLDLDSNAGCGSDGPRAENVFWASGLIPPKGEYIVRVDYWSNCGAVKTDYVVTINVRGKAPVVYTGSFTGPGDGGGKGSGRHVATVIK